MRISEYPPPGAFELEGAEETRQEAVLFILTLEILFYRLKSFSSLLCREWISGERVEQEDLGRVGGR